MTDEDVELELEEPELEELEDDESEVEVETEVIVRKPKEPEARFGWCMSIQHELCPKESNGLVCHCPCENHGTEYELAEGDGMSDSLREISARYGK